MPTLGDDVSSTELYDPLAGEWIVTASSGAANGAATLLPSGQVLVVGGMLGEFTFYPRALTNSEMFNPDLGVWIQTMPLAAAHSGHTATLLPNGNVLVAGGLSGTRNSAKVSTRIPQPGPPRADSIPNAADTLRFCSPTEVS